MSCTKRFMNFHWEHHSWRPRVTFSETVAHLEPDMWARDHYRDYVRCDKEEVCDVCGVVRKQVSCLCDVEKGERCAILNEWKATH